MMDLLSKDKLDKEGDDIQQVTRASTWAAMTHTTSPPLKEGQSLVKLPRHASNTNSSALGLEDLPPHPARLTF